MIASRPMQWLYHLVPRGTDPGMTYAAPSLGAEGFVHASYAAAVEESARLYFPRDEPPVAWRIDPRRLDADVEVASTPRGSMPHILGAVAADAIVGVHEARTWGALPDRVTGHRIAFLAFEGMTLLDLVGPLDAVSRLRTMGFDPEVVTEVVGANGPTLRCPEGVTLTLDAVRPALTGYDVVVIPGGRGAERLLDDPDVRAWLAARPGHHAWASVCTGALVLAGLGLLRGRSAATHHSARGALSAHDGVRVVGERVVRDGPVLTSGGVTAGIELGLALVEQLADLSTATLIAAQMEHEGRTSERVAHG